jgi:CheY-like chemotaxis protein
VNRFLLSDELADAGHTVIEAGSALEAIAISRKCDPLVGVITDVDMPGGLNGLDLMRLVPSTRPATCDRVVSGRNVRSRIEPGVSFLPKPCDYRELAHRVAEAAPVNEACQGRQQARV